MAGEAVQIIYVQKREGCIQSGVGGAGSTKLASRQDDLQV